MKLSTSIGIRNNKTAGNTLLLAQMILQCNVLFFSDLAIQWPALVLCRILVHLCHTNSFHEFFFTTHYETYIMCFLNNDINFSRDETLTFISSTFTMLFTKFITKLLYKCHICTGNFVLFIAFIYLCNFLLITFIFTSHLFYFFHAGNTAYSG